MTRKNLTLSVLLLAGAGGAFAPRAESLSQDDQALVFPEVPAGSTSDLVMSAFRPRSAPARDLFPVADNFVGHDLLLSNQGTGGTVRQRNLQLLGGTILVYDLPTRIEPTLEILKRLDETFAEERARDVRVVKEYEARFLSLDTLIEGLDPYIAQLSQGTGTSRARRAARNVTAIHERNVLVLYDSADRVEEMLGHLTNMDVAPHQVLMTCFLVQPSDKAGSGPALPQELVAGLRNLIGAPHLERVGFAMVRSFVGRRDALSIMLESEALGSFRFALSPVAYDVKTSTLSMSGCTLTASENTRYTNGLPLFSTNATVKSGEYTVIGAAGANPLFVVLRCQPL